MRYVVLAFGVLWSGAAIALPPNHFAPYRPPAPVEEAKPAFELAQVATKSAQIKAARWSGGSQTVVSVPQWSKWLNSEVPARDSASLGSVADGTLNQGTELPTTGVGYRIFDRHQGYGTRWGTPELIHAIKSAAAFVNENHQGAPLMIGNLSRSRGGDIPWSRSHNSGRDADLAFYVLDQTGKSVPAPELLKFDDSGIPPAMPHLKFDVERNWAVVKGLLQSGVQIQYLFISLGLKAMLLEHAQTLGEPAWLIAMASDVLHQPHDALPHDDHFHLRIACQPDDRLLGCLEGGPSWEWGEWSEPSLLAHAMEMSRGFEQGSADEKIAILEHLKAISSPFLADVAAHWGLDATDPAIKDASLYAIHNAWPWSGGVLSRLMEFIVDEAETDEQRALAYSVLRRSMAPEVKDFALARVRNTGLSEAERIMAARSLIHFMEPDLLEPLLDEAESQPELVAAELLKIVERISLVGATTDSNLQDQKARETEIAKWREWMQANAQVGREIWLLTGLQSMGFKHAHLEPANIGELIRLLPDAPEFMVYNINRTLREISGRWSPLEQLDGHKLEAYWSKWWKKNKDRYQTN